MTKTIERSTCGAWLLACTLACACDKEQDVAVPVSTTAIEPVAEGAPATDLPTAESLLDKAVVASGGLAAFQAITSYRYTADVSLVKQNIHGKAEHWAAGGDFYSRQDLPGVGVIEAGKLGDTLWSRDPILGLRKLEGREAEQHSWTSSLLLVAEWKRFFDEAKTVGERTADDGTKLYDVELQSKLGAKVTIAFDAASGLPREHAFEPVTPMGSMPVRALLEDYRKVGGLELPFRQITDASLATAEQQITGVEINVDVDLSLFEMPTGAAEVVSGTPTKPE